MRGYGKFDRVGLSGGHYDYVYSGPCSRHDPQGALATVGTYSLTMSDPKNKNPVADHDKYMTVY
jgi:hypothetical protein